MGDRVLFQLYRRGPVGSPDAVSPVIYGHWCGSNAPAYVAKLREVMASRGPDLDYAAARLVAILCGDAPGNLSVGMWNAPLLDGGRERLLHEGDSHGDAGIVLIDVSDYSARYIGGYLARQTAPGAH